MKWMSEGGQRKRGGRPCRKNWRATIEDDLNVMEMSGKEAEKTLEDDDEVAKCVATRAEGMHVKD